MKIHWRYLIATAFFFISWISSADAQVVLERVSITERADGRGFVVRNHLSSMPNSFQVVQSAENRIQFVIYSEGIVSENFMEAALHRDIEEIDYYAGPGYFAYEIKMRDGVYFLANAYPDVNQTDVLLALERVTAARVAGVLEQGLELFDGEPLSDEEVATIDPERSYPTVEETVLMEESRVSAMFGIKGGWTSANIYGVGYERNSRSGVTIATSAIVDFPAHLPYDLTLGLETGVYFSQKGIINPASAKFSGIEIEFDYIEIPVLAKLKYREQNRFSPHIILGPYLGFMVNAESVEEGGERIDLDEFTRSVDFGGLAGIGVDIRLGEVVMDIQVRQSLGFNTLFDEISFDDDEKLRQLSLVVGVRF